MNTLLKYIKPHLPKMSGQIVIKFIGTITDLVLPMLLAYIIDDVAPTKNMNLVFLYGGLMLVCAGIGISFNIIANRMAMRNARDITEKLRHDLFCKVSYLSSEQTDKFTAPSLMSRLTSDTYYVHQMIDRMQRLGVRAPILLIGGIILTLILDPVLALILIATLPLLSVIILYISKKGVNLYTKTQAASDKMVRKVQESATGIRVIKALSKTEYEKSQFDKANQDLVRADQKAGTLMAVSSPVMNIILYSGQVLAIVVGAYRVHQGLMLSGKIIAFLTLFNYILIALMTVTRLFVMYSRGAASANRISEVLNAPSELAVEDIPSEQSDSHIEFRNVTFSYNKVRDNIKDVSFKLGRGATLGIIGATGSGKSTLINLLLRFYDADSGQIFIDGKDVRSVDAQELRSKLGVVFQNDFIMADTITENIDFGRGLGHDAVEKAAKTAQAGFIHQKEGEFSHKLTVRGANLSGGQKQRLLIARALAGDPEILILDDSSSALDYLTDASLRKALKANYKNCTKIIITQRVSTVMSADKIIMLDEGKIVDSGTHKELLKNCGAYKEIYDVQMGTLV